MKTFTTRGAILNAISWMLLTNGLSAAPLATALEPENVHTFMWFGNDGTPDDTREPVFKFDGEQLEAERVVGFKVPSMRLPKGSVVEFVFPDDAKVSDPEFIIPLYGCGLVQEWIRMGVKVRYQHRGNMIARDELVIRFAEHCFNLDCAEVSLNGVKIGTGRKVFAELISRTWREDSFLTVRFIHEYTQFPSMPTVALPGDLVDVLDKANVKCEYSNEFLGMKDAWELLSEASRKKP